ncbi:MAG: hypothetical protein AUF79_14020 [Crenarchaeota archaeon 13_1_20CM_2_51_8]|nr:MAG: hypothetical protein AUF79_14020 [Crenarchaeota archaeon 13_1_20CM_2_51_8]
MGGELRLELMIVSDSRAREKAVQLKRAESALHDDQLAERSIEIRGELILRPEPRSKAERLL